MTQSRLLASGRQSPREEITKLFQLHMSSLLNGAPIAPIYKTVNLTLLASGGKLLVFSVWWPRVSPKRCRDLCDRPEQDERIGL
jgi:hypothetical protein